MLFPEQKAEKARAAEEKLQDLKVLVADLDSALASPDSGADPSSAKQIAKKYDVSFNELWDIYNVCIFILCASQQLCIVDPDFNVIAGWKVT